MSKMGFMNPSITTTPVKKSIEKENQSKGKSPTKPQGQKEFSQRTPTSKTSERRQSGRLQRMDSKKEKINKRVFTNHDIKKSLQHQIHNRSAGSSREKSPLRKIKLQNIELLKKVFILYSSGCSGGNLNVQIVKGLLKSKIASNQYLSDYRLQQNLEDKSFLISPQLQNGSRILYKIEELPVIEHSVNITIDIIKEIATIIYDNYIKYDAFLLLVGNDTICTIGTYLSFMFQNLSKLIICTGGLFPISYMRTDLIENLVASFSIIGSAQNLNDVLIVGSSKAYRANRAIKMKEGQLKSVDSPNLQPLISINIKIKFRENLFLPAPKEECRLWTELSQKVGIIRFNILISLQALEYQLSNPAYDGYVIEGHASNSLPNKPEILNLFKKMAEQKGKIFITITETVSKMKMNNTSLRQYLEQFHIYWGGDMTLNAAFAKLSYLLSKEYDRTEIKKLIYNNLRGQLSEVQRQNQFEYETQSFMEIVINSIERFYPTKKFPEFIEEIQDTIAKYAVHDSNAKQIQQFFKKVHIDENLQETDYSQTLSNLIDRNNLLHKAVKVGNQALYQYFLEFDIDINKLDEDQCSPLFYAVVKRQKKTILYLCKKGGNVICPLDQLFQMIIEAFQKDEKQFLELLYHIEFKRTLKQLRNAQGRTAAHLAAIFGAQNCLQYLLSKFKINLKLKDNYGKEYSDYLKHRNS